jgi:hypothetical protein
MVKVLWPGSVISQNPDEGSKHDYMGQNLGPYTLTLTRRFLSCKRRESPQHWLNVEIQHNWMEAD